MKLGDRRLSLVALVGMLMLTGVGHAGETVRLGVTQGTVLPVVN